MHKHKIAFFIDGGYVIRRVRFFHRKYFPHHELKPEHVVTIIYHLVKKHKEALKRDELYRIYYYDAPPLDKQLRFPLPAPGHLTPGTKNCRLEPDYLFQTALHEKLKSFRKLALRMGKLSNSGQWQIKDKVLKDLLSREKQFSDLGNDDFYFSVQQKGVDTRIGVYITTLTLNRYADTIVLMASDADFVPVAKLARTHGIDVVLDPLWGKVDADLQTHIDGKQSFDVVGQLRHIFQHEPEPRPSMTIKDKQALHTVEEVADILNVSRSYLVRLLEQGEIPHHKVGRHRRVRYQDLMDYKTAMDIKRSSALDELSALSWKYDPEY